jgi:lysophospholipid acyltransferase (LPLAT)-like uncharacterized protein
MLKDKIKHLKSKPFFRTLALAVVHILMRLLIATYRVQIKKKLDRPTADRFNLLNETEGIFYTWHQNIIALAGFLYKNNSNIHCVVSPSGDGKAVGDITKKLGLRVLYGSAHKEPIKLVRNALKILKSEKKLFLIGDGSRGPAKKLQPGISYLAKKSGLPIIYIQLEANWKITLSKTWDKFQIPLPFSKITVTLLEDRCSSK